MAMTPFGWEEGDEDFWRPMESKETHTQCLLVTDMGEQKVAWIPSVRAKLNKVKIEGKVFTVKERYTTALTRDAIDDSSDYRRHRKTTDISEWKKLNTGS